MRSLWTVGNVGRSRTRRSRSVRGWAIRRWRLTGHPRRATGAGKLDRAAAKSREIQSIPYASFGLRPSRRLDRGRLTARLRVQYVQYGLNVPNAAFFAGHPHFLCSASSTAPLLRTCPHVLGNTPTTRTLLHRTCRREWPRRAPIHRRRGGGECGRDHRLCSPHAHGGGASQTGRIVAEIGDFETDLLLLDSVCNLLAATHFSPRVFTSTPVVSGEKAVSEKKLNAPAPTALALPAPLQTLIKKAQKGDESVMPQLRDSSTVRRANRLLGPNRPRSRRPDPQVCSDNRLTKEIVRREIRQLPQSLPAPCRPPSNGYWRPSRSVGWNFRPMVVSGVGRRGIQGLLAKTRHSRQSAVSGRAAVVDKCADCRARPCKSTSASNRSISAVEAPLRRYLLRFRRRNGRC